ncbi:DNA cytosine methyltransferase [Palleronia sp. LCG004]|uniref:DNA cytosine methyltransferase n=1 Tax=Palleronia sp. LCG004 TaxID=3079304 RepID=UPI002942B39C|nr:DNA cytosine methyltransferase [Palleronia sp. LCG004]WOI54986.1 DNA cytosine methyltransferase [Palleronia sp. LCG004]
MIMVPRSEKLPRFAEFFCGGGMVRAGLPGWECAFANDIDPMKCTAYRENFGGDALIEGDIAHVSDDALQQRIDLYWASSPCQDFSLAGKGAGLEGARSGVFGTWISRIAPLIAAGHAPKIIAFENVTGLVTRREGRDFLSVVSDLQRLGYLVGALSIDAARFVPQSRPRLFVICIREDAVPPDLAGAEPSEPFHTPALRRFRERHAAEIGDRWRWWSLPEPTEPRRELVDCVEWTGPHRWLSEPEIQHLLGMMSPPSRDRVTAARRSGEPRIGMLYRRGRPDAEGRIRQRAEVRFDGLAGCLRTPSGGSSRQTMLLIDGDETRARLLSAREAIRLMGLGDGYRIPERYNAAYKVAGDGVVAPIVTYLDRHLFQPVLARTRAVIAA